MAFEVTERSILVISGCHHKRLRATSLNSQKGPCIQTKKPLLCNALMLPLLMLFLTMIKSRRKTEGRKGYKKEGSRVRQSVGEISRGRKQGRSSERWMSCVCFTTHMLHRHKFLYLVYFHPVLHSVFHQGQQHAAA